MGTDRQGKTTVESFTRRNNADDDDTIKKIEDFAAKDTRSRSWVIMEALREYVKNHGSGNPQTDIRVFTGEVGAPPALQEDPKWIAKVARYYGISKEQAAAKIKRGAV
ncbi:MAG TPA: ribbon-helix-helix protein, CopG family [Nitrososphaerales archaeon]|nr:ribbon-helix-helix protein, CopG family [Nitrososphaerales archaeon]